MEAIAPLHRSFPDRRSTNVRNTFVSSCPPTFAESAAASMRWERRGVLGRLVRLDDPVAGRR
jgi:hypothetical protein